MISAEQMLSKRTQNCEGVNAVAVPEAGWYGLLASVQSVCTDVTVGRVDEVPLPPDDVPLEPDAPLAEPVAPLALPDDPEAPLAVPELAPLAPDALPVAPVLLPLVLPEEPEAPELPVDAPLAVPLVEPLVLPVLPAEVPVPPPELDPLGEVSPVVDEPEEDEGLLFPHATARSPTATLTPNLFRTFIFSPSMDKETRRNCARTLRSEEPRVKCRFANRAYLISKASTVSSCMRGTRSRDRFVSKPMSAGDF